MLNNSTNKVYIVNSRPFIKVLNDGDSFKAVDAKGKIYSKEEYMDLVKINHESSCDYKRALESTKADIKETKGYVYSFPLEQLGLFGATILTSAMFYGVGIGTNKLYSLFSHNETDDFMPLCVAGFAIFSGIKAMSESSDMHSDYKESIKEEKRNIKKLKKLLSELKQLKVDVDQVEEKLIEDPSLDKIDIKQLRIKR